MKKEAFLFLILFSTLAAAAVNVQVDLPKVRHVYMNNENIPLQITLSNSISKAAFFDMNISIQQNTFRLATLNHSARSLSGQEVETADYSFTPSDYLGVFFAGNVSLVIEVIKNETVTGSESVPLELLRPVDSGDTKIRVLYYPSQINVSEGETANFSIDFMIFSHPGLELLFNISDLGLNYTASTRTFSSFELAYINVTLRGDEPGEHTGQFMIYHNWFPIDERGLITVNVAAAGPPEPQKEYSLSVSTDDNLLEAVVLIGSDPVEGAVLSLVLPDSGRVNITTDSTGTATYTLDEDGEYVVMLENETVNLTDSVTYLAYTPTCGDGNCESGETVENCISDCCMGTICGSSCQTGQGVCCEGSWIPSADCCSDSDCSEGQTCESYSCTTQQQLAASLPEDRTMPLVFLGAAIFVNILMILVVADVIKL